MRLEVETKLHRNLTILSEEHGQRLSMERKSSVNAAGDPIPWYTYPALENLAQFDFSGCRVFEYGCGHSSLWWASRATQVYSVEHEPQWAATITAAAPGNLKVIHATTKADYVAAITMHDGPYEVIVIDGRWRLACAQTAPDHLCAGGLIIFDNADWYVEAPAVLAAKGFIRMDFSGFGPINNYCWTTSLFLKADLRFARKDAFTPPAGGIHSNGDHADY